MNLPTQLNGLSIIQVVDDGDTSGITTYSDGTKGYWGEETAVYVKPDGTKWGENGYEDNPTDYDRMARGMGDQFEWDRSNDRTMTRDEYIEYQMIMNDATREEAETQANEWEDWTRGYNEMDGILSQ